VIFRRDAHRHGHQRGHGCAGSLHRRRGSGDTLLRGFTAPRHLVRSVRCLQRYWPSWGLDPGQDTDRPVGRTA
jgi:hypothetical protein